MNLREVLKPLQVEAVTDGTRTKAVISVFSAHSGLQDAFDDDWQAGRLSAGGYLNGTEDGILAYKLLLQTGSEKDPLNYKQVRGPAMVSGNDSDWVLMDLSHAVFQLSSRRLLTAEGLIPPEVFYIYLTAWVSNDPLGYAASQANFYPPPREWMHDMYDATGENLRSKSSPQLWSLWRHVGGVLRNSGHFHGQFQLLNPWSSLSSPST